MPCLKRGNLHANRDAQMAGTAGLYHAPQAADLHSALREPCYKACAVRVLHMPTMQHGEIAHLGAPEAGACCLKGGAKQAAQAP